MGQLDGCCEGNPLTDSNNLHDRIGQLSNSQRSWLADQLSESSAVSGAGNQELAAWIVCNHDIDDTTLREELGRSIPSSLVPRHFIRIPAIPKTASGKPDRKELATSHFRPAAPAATEARQREVTTGSGHILIEVCQTLLKVNDISLQDNFYHIGGDSLMSIQLIALARQRGVEVEPRDVVQCRTLGELALASDRRKGRTDEKSPTVLETIPVISQIRSGTGRGAILLVHEVGGQCHYSHHLAPQLSSGLSLFATTQPAHGKSPTTIEELARLYCEHWLDIAPQGPVTLISFCWGGLLAYELSKQLRQAGQNVDALVIVESGTEAAYAYAPSANRRLDWLKGFRIRLQNRLSGASFTELVSAGSRRLLRTPPKKIDADAGFQFRDEEGDPDQIRSNVQAFLDYQIAPSDQPIHLFRAGKTGLIGTRYSDRAYGWKYLVGKRLKIHDTAGTHDTCMQPPNVNDLAEKINGILQRDLGDLSSQGDDGVS